MMVVYHWPAGRIVARFQRIGHGPDAFGPLTGGIASRTGHKDKVPGSVPPDVDAAVVIVPTIAIVESLEKLCFT